MRAATCFSGERPIAVDLFTGLHGWSEGLVAKGWRVIGFDIEDMCAQFGEPRPEHVSLVIQDVMTIHGSQFKDAGLIVASPPCQEYSYMAMPWSLAKAKAAAIRADETGAELERLNALFNACFRIQREASEAAGHHIPMVVENVRGAIPWVGRSRWNYGSFHLWGDVPALMPSTGRSALKHGVAHRGDGATNFHRDLNNGVKAPGMNWSDQSKRGQDFTRIAGRHAAEGMKNGGGGSWFGINPDGSKGALNNARHGSKSSARKAASARIAKIPATLSHWIAAHYFPQKESIMATQRPRTASAS